MILLRRFPVAAAGIDAGQIVEENADDGIVRHLTPLGDDLQGAPRVVQRLGGAAGRRINRGQIVQHMDHVPAVQAADALEHFQRLRGVFLRLVGLAHLAV